MKILVTGAAGFIGYHLSKSLLDDNMDVLGVDNLNNYYYPKLKRNRLELLTQYNNFSFKKNDISNHDSISKVFKYYKPNKVINLAAQAGVRYGMVNPYSYMTSNLVGFSTGVCALSSNCNAANSCIPGTT